MIPYPDCKEHYHPACLGTTREAVENGGLEFFKCSAYDPVSMLFARNDAAIHRSRNSGECTDELESS